MTKLIVRQLKSHDKRQKKKLLKSDNAIAGLLDGMLDLDGDRPQAGVKFTHSPGPSKPQPEPDQDQDSSGDTARQGLLESGTVASQKAPSTRIAGSVVAPRSVAGGAFFTTALGGHSLKAKKQGNKRITTKAKRRLERKLELGANFADAMEVRREKEVAKKERKQRLKNLY
jgi:hypothetical protein